MRATMSSSRSDSWILRNLLAYDWNAQALAIEPSLRWVVNQNLSLQIGANLLFGDEGRRHNIRDLCPGGVLDARIIPGSGLCLCIFTSCHDHPWGALAIVDRSLGVDGREPVVRTWPAEAIDQVGKGGFDSFKRINPKYEDPWPLSETTFLVSRQVVPGKPKVGLFLVDTFGNELLLHDGNRGCFDPMPGRLFDCRGCVWGTPHSICTATRRCP